MTKLTIVQPEIGKPDSTEDVKIVNAFTALMAWANGEIDGANIKKSYTEALEAFGGHASGDLRLTTKTALDEGWLKCEGQAVSRATFKKLFEAIGTAYGEGDKATTFNVPDYRGRAPVGSGEGAGLTNRVTGAKGGEEKHILTVGELAKHSHTYSKPIAQEKLNAGAESIRSVAVEGAAATGEAGANEGHNNMQPFSVCNVWIKT